MKKTIGIFAHVDAGKTTFAEQLLYYTGMIQKVGRVDHQSASLDTHSIEKRRGITIFSDQAFFTYESDDYYLIDTPGHVDFSSEMERSIGILDYAVIIISGIDGVQSHTETVYEMLKAAGVPIMFFINKLDANHADCEKVMKALTVTFGQIVSFDTLDFEALATYSDHLMEAFFDDDLDESLFLNHAKEMFGQGEIHPVISGSALKGVGIKRFLEVLHLLTETFYPDKEVSGVVYKIKYINGVRHGLIKLNGGTLHIRDMVGEEKITGIKTLFGSKMHVVDTLSAGEIGAVTGLTLNVGEAFGATKNMSYSVVPTLKTKLNFDEHLNPKDVYRDMKILEDEDPSLMIEFSEKKEITLGIMGDVQLEILEEEIPNRFGYAVAFEAPQIIYKETIADKVMGCGHFEPLKHYAEVILMIEKGCKGSGLVFDNQCSTDDLTIGHQNLIRHHLFEKAHRGILTGSEVTDVKITLVTGRGHNKHTSGGDFREATIRALRQGLEQAENILLEPVYGLSIQVPHEYMGKVLTDITVASGVAQAVVEGAHAIITGKVPVYTFRNYQSKLLNITKGKGRMRLTVTGYEPCHNTEEVVESIGYDKITDDAYPSSSIFCSKGKGYTVPWEEASAHMHCL